ncbi:uncharacterized protein MAM_01340 [Metarhizium album ARSEF 1941]|uniref:Uncharacterized protein n=1 Tax=Metarhizium album (strain ARSEF 1941) TaxID=1081103 RepID=A0A0B2WWG6_METAS|nr:uncharacterized protein MAM_01340 [Metarhizium album ARSEF 1941]KHO00562.1 hypothetical protein MAM_01340 [Metarhizium album ARSEF 1941]
MRPKWPYTHGSPDADKVQPEAYALHQAPVDSVGSKDVQLGLFYGYRAKLARCPKLQRSSSRIRPSTVGSLVVSQTSPVDSLTAASAAAATDMDQCERCKKRFPGPRLVRCDTCFTKTCLWCQCEVVGGLHSHINDCFTFPNNPAAAFDPLFKPSLAVFSPRRGLAQPIQRPFTAILDKTWILKRPKEDAYRLLIDSYRLRVHDSFLFEGVTRPDTIYSGCPDSESDFVRYLQAARAKGLLPPWWTQETLQACRDMGMADFQFHSLKQQLSQAMVVDYYQDATFPTQLRLFAEDVLGRGTCLRSCRQSLDALVDMEGQEAGGTRIFDWNAYNSAYAHQDWERI